MARLVAALTLGLGVALGASDASACDCDGGVGFMVPDSKTTDVPSNTLVWVSAIACTPTLATADGAEVPTTSTALTHRGSTVTVLRPQAALEIGATYRVNGCTGVSGNTFTVTEGPDTTPPPAPTFSRGEQHTSPETSCGTEDYTDLVVNGENSLLVLDVAGRSQLDGPAVQGSVVDFLFSSAGVYVGGRPCSSNWYFEKDGEATDVRLAAYDLAGNFSGWGSPQNVESAAPSDAGCAVPSPALPARPGVALAGLLPALALLVRRARR
jgi:hypothetical protein